MREVSENENEKEHWHLDKRVPLGLIVALVVQLGAFVYVTGQQSAKIEQAISQSAANAMAISEVRAIATNNRQSIAVQVETQRMTAEVLQRQDERMARIEDKLDSRQP